MHNTNTHSANLDHYLSAIRSCQLMPAFTLLQLSELWPCNEISLLDRKKNWENPMTLDVERTSLNLWSWRRERKLSSWNWAKPRRCSSMRSPEWLTICSRYVFKARKHVIYAHNCKWMSAVEWLFLHRIFVFYLWKCSWSFLHSVLLVNSHDVHTWTAFSKLIIL